jgi:hypothetical protein
MVPLDRETSNALIEVLEDWGHQLKHSDFERIVASLEDEESETDAPSPGGLS